MSTLKEMVPDSWHDVIGEEFNKAYWSKLEAFLEEEWKTQTIFPPKEHIFSALSYTDYDDVRVLILGQDPYHGPGQAHGLSFSVLPGVKTPPSLRNIYKELKSDLGCSIPNNGFLEPWAEQGVMMLNAVLTVRKKSANSHKSKGWEKFTNAIIKKLAARPQPMVFVLWGGYAKKKAKYIDGDKHTIIQSAHPSPLSAHNGFFGTQPFSQVNEALEGYGMTPIDWQIPDIQP